MTTTEQLRPPGARTPERPQPAVAPPTPAPAESLLDTLAHELERLGVPSCQWKGHAKRERWLSGDGDVDLLFEPETWPTAEALLLQLGFKRALAPRWLALPGIESYVGLDRATGRLVHVHAYHQLVVGPAWRTTYSLPLARSVLHQATPSHYFRAPAPEHELVLIVLHAAARTTLLRTLIPARGDWVRAARRDVQRLEPVVDWPTVVAFLDRELPSVPIRIFEPCLDAFLHRLPGWRRWARARVLTWTLGAFAHRASLPRRAAGLLSGIAGAVRLGGPDTRKRLAAGGRVLALVGGDGAGKTSCATELTAWLSKELATLRVHLGRPPRALSTLSVGAALKLARLLHRGLAAHLELLRAVCTARDRYRLYHRAWQFAARGGVVLAERYPIPENYALCGPSEEQGLLADVDTPLARLLRRVEWTFYEWMRPPDATLVLQLDPEIAVERKTDEPEGYVRARARIVWHTDWARVAGAHVVDAERPLPEVVSDLKALVWTLL